MLLFHMRTHAKLAIFRRFGQRKTYSLMLVVSPSVVILELPRADRRPAPSGKDFRQFLKAAAFLQRPSNFRNVCFGVEYLRQTNRIAGAFFAFRQFHEVFHQVYYHALLKLYCSPLLRHFAVLLS
jgi:hypothetical protein